MDARVIGLALAIDRLFGEPPNTLHPVAWLGRLLKALERRTPQGRPATELCGGAGMAAAAVLAAGVPALIWQRSSRAGRRQDIMLSALLLKAAFAWRALLDSGGLVRERLEVDDLEGARRAAGMIVSRDTSQLDAALTAAAAIESLAENASDSVVAPLLYYACFGLVGAYVYRAVNTLDAVVGYRGSYEYLGKVPARLDDLLNLVPARLTGLLIVLAARLGGGSSSRAWRAMRRDGRLTASPNAGLPMSAMAGALDVRLEKQDHYRLNAAGRTPQAEDLRSAAHIVTGALALAALASAGACAARQIIVTRCRGRYACSPTS